MMTTAAVPRTISEARAFLNRHEITFVDIEDVSTVGTVRAASLIKTSGGPDWFIKELDATLEREDTIYNLAADGLVPEGIARRLTPRYDIGCNEGIRVYKGFRAHRTWHDMLRTRDGYDPDHAYKVGTWVGEMHREAIPSKALLDYAEALAPVSVRTYAVITVEAYANAPGFQFKAFLRTAQRASKALAVLAETAHSFSIMVHGDLKADNLLFKDQGIRLVDWELCSLGHPMSDVGTLVGSVLSSWFELIPPRVGKPIIEWFAGGTVPASCVSLTLDALLQGYEDAMSAPLSTEYRKTLWSYAGYFLLERGHVANATQGRLGLGTKLSMEMGERLLIRPELGPETFL